MFPMPVTAAVMARGRERFNVFCSPCHGRTGDGNGMIVQRGFRQPPSYHEQRLREAPAGYFFDVMTNGFGAMQDYAAQVPVADRWAIAAYIRALQLSQGATVGDVPADRRADLRSTRAGEPVNVDTTYSPPAADIDRAPVARADRGRRLASSGAASACSSIATTFSAPGWSPTCCSSASPSGRWR